MSKKARTTTRQLRSRRVFTNCCFAVAAHEGRLIKGIDSTSAFGSESLTEEDGDIFVEFPEVLDQHFGDLLDAQLEE